MVSNIHSKKTQPTNRRQIMTSYDRLREEGRFTKAGSHRGVAELYDGTHSHIDPIHARFSDNGTVKCVILNDKPGANILYLQGYMVEELYKEWKKKLGAFGPSDSLLEKEEATYDVKLTKKQLGVLHQILAWEEGH